MISSLRLQNFRSFTDGQFEFEPGVTIIVGPNGSGKTSILESLFFACLGGSYKASDSDAMAYGKTWSRIDILQADGQERTVKLEYDEQRDAAKKSFVINDATRIRLQSHQKIATVLFEPQDMNIITGEPTLRRDFIDAILSVCVPAYDGYIKNYRRALVQRNALLKRPTAPKKDELFVWDLRLSELGGVVHGVRAKLIDSFAVGLQQSYESISHKKDAVAIAYISDAGTSDYAETMLAKLHTNYDKDITRGFTSSGPHRDDIMLTIRGQDAKIAASRGEIRSMLLALKIMQLTEIEAATGARPIILLDDVFSELDGARRQALAATLKDYQTFITTTDADLVVDHFSDKAHIIALG